MLQWNKEIRHDREKRLKETLNYEDERMKDYSRRKHDTRMKHYIMRMKEWNITRKQGTRMKHYITMEQDITRKRTEEMLL